MIYLGSDHRGFNLKENLKLKLSKHNYQFIDVGAYNYDPNDDYPLIAFEVSEKVLESKENRGIVLCGSGVGVCIAVNRIKGIRGVSSDNYQIIKKAREDDDVNILCLPADFLDEEKAWLLIEVFLNTPFKNEKKYLRRIRQLDQNDYH
ncbi:MAG: RpiB/LacA/LacB family sugar-phosphate isomerase [Patescibacteria group bacterium]|nr:RpiB/LacA/LacB family sugar-phosphate isomerase [Patescibacteria group bacterium]